MIHTKEAIINALEVIKSECDSTECEKCPFGRRNSHHSYECVINKGIPEDWVITKEEPTWRALE